MKITSLIENNHGQAEDLEAEHGLAILIEVDGKKILFDTGQSGAFIDNAKKLGINLKDLDSVIISHGHYDHSGGFVRLVEEIKPRIKLYLGEGFFTPKYSLREKGHYEYTGNAFDQGFLDDHQIETKVIKDEIDDLSENLFVMTDFLRDSAFENTNQTMFLKEEDQFKKDLFSDEIAIGIKSDQGLVILVGCSHVGIVNILETFTQRTGLPIYAVIGGLHLVKEDDEKINTIIDYLKEKEIKIIGACHCTGKQGETMLGQQLAEAFISNHPGEVFEL